MVFLGMMSFVEDEQIDITHADERMHQTLVEDVCCTDNHFTFGKGRLPNASVPQVTAHLAAKAIDGLVQIAIENSILVKDQERRIDLLSA